jgi:hypothetical protein
MRHQRLIQWNVELLSQLLTQIITHRSLTNGVVDTPEELNECFVQNCNVRSVDEVQRSSNLPIPNKI